MTTTAFISHATVAKYSRVTGENQDALFAPTGSVRLKDGIVVAVADGVSNSELPDQAAAAAIRAVKEYPAKESTRGLIELIDMAHQQVAAIETTATGSQSPASTLVSAELTETQVHIVSVGDSRAYLYDDGQLTQLTVDDTVAEEMVTSGLLDPKDRGAHPMSNALTKAIGRTSAQDVTPAVKSFAPAQDQVLLLCSDGVYAGLDESDLGALIESAATDDLATYLVQAAVERKVNDDITAVTVIFGN